MFVLFVSSSHSSSVIVALKSGGLFDTVKFCIGIVPLVFPAESLANDFHETVSPLLR